MSEGRHLLYSWFPQAEDLNILATHLLQMQDPQDSHGLAKFFSRHPMIPCPCKSCEARSLISFKIKNNR